MLGPKFYLIQHRFFIPRSYLCFFSHIDPTRKPRLNNVWINMINPFKTNHDKKSQTKSPKSGLWKEMDHLRESHKISICLAINDFSALSILSRSLIHFEQYWRRFRYSLLQIKPRKYIEYLSTESKPRVEIDQLSMMNNLALN